MNKQFLLFLGIIVIFLHSANTTNLRGGQQQTMQPDTASEQKIELVQESQLVSQVQIKSKDGESNDESDGESGEVKNFWNWIFGGIDSEESESTEEADGEGNFFERLFDGDFFSYVETKEIPQLIQMRDGEDGENSGEEEEDESVLDWVNDTIFGDDDDDDDDDDGLFGAFSLAQIGDGESSQEESEEDDIGFIDWIIDKLTFWDNDDGEDSLIPDIGIDGEFLPDVPVPNPLDAVDGEIIPDIVFSQTKTSCKDPVAEKWGKQVYNKDWSGKWKFNKAGDVFGVQYNNEFLALAKFDSEGDAYLLFENNEACKNNLTNFVNVKLQERNVADIESMTQEDDLEYISLLNDSEVVFLATADDVNFGLFGGDDDDDGFSFNIWDGEFSLKDVVPEGKAYDDGEGGGGIFEDFATAVGDGLDVLGDGFEAVTDGEGFIGGIGGFVKDAVVTVGETGMDGVGYLTDGEDGFIVDIYGTAGDAYGTVADGEVVGTVTGTVAEGADAVTDTASQAAGSVTDGELIPDLP